MKPTHTQNIGVSSCLLGNAVRYDGQHKYNSVLVTELGQMFNLVPFCPEMAIGMGVPRAPIHLITINDTLHAVDREHGAPDYTQQLQQQANKYHADSSPLSGYIFQEKSPSCGYRSTKVHDQKGEILNTQGTGIFAAAIHSLLPDLPIIEAVDLDEPQKIQRFIQQVQEYANSSNAMKPV